MIKTSFMILATLSLALEAEPGARVGVAIDFGPVTLVPGQAMQLCASNLYDDSPVVIRFLFVDAISGRVVEQRDITVPGRQGSCATHDVRGATTSTLIGLLAPPPNARGGWDRVLTLGTTSGQVVEGRKATVFVPAVQRFNVIVPAVQ